jgi:hypothetical protein
MIVGSLEEKLAVMNGERPNRKEKASVRIEDLDGLLTILPKLKSAKAAADPPTKAEFDALVDDVAMLHTRLLAIAETVGARRR